MPPPAPTLLCAEHLIAGHFRLRRSAAWGFAAALVLAVPAATFAARSWSPWFGIPAAFIAVLTLVRYLRGRDRLHRALRCPVCGSGNGQLLWGARAAYDCRDCKKLSPTDCRMSRHHAKPVNIGPACSSSPRPPPTTSPHLPR